MTSVGIAATFDPYAISATGVRLKTLNIVENHKLLRFEALNVSLGTHFSLGQIVDLFKKKEDKNEGRGTKNEERKPREEGEDRKERLEGADESLLDFFKSFNISHNFNLTAQNVAGTNRDTLYISNNTFNTQGSLKLSKNWNLVIGNIGYDFARKTLSYPDFGVRRDLHCWEAGLDYQPTRGTFSFYLRVKPGSLNFINIPYKKNFYDAQTLR